MSEIKSTIDLRFKGADWYGNPQHIVVGGAGTIGSNLVPLLTRLQHTIYLFDMDTVEEHNLGVQLFSMNSIGKLKTEAVRDINNLVSSKWVRACFGEYQEDSITSNIMISCFDNMKARKIIFNNWVKTLKEEKFKESLFIDGRMDFNQFQIYFVTPDRIENYKKVLFDDDDIDTVPCSLQTTPFIGPTIAGMMASGLCNFIGNIKLKDDVYAVPFKIEFVFPTLIFNFKD